MLDLELFELTIQTKKNGYEVINFIKTMNYVNQQQPIGTFYKRLLVWKNLSFELHTETDMQLSVERLTC